MQIPTERSTGGLFFGYIWSTDRMQVMVVKLEMMDKLKGKNNLIFSFLLEKGRIGNKKNQHKDVKEKKEKKLNLFYLFWCHQMVIGAFFDNFFIRHIWFVFLFQSTRYSHPDLRTQWMWDPLLNHLSEFLWSRQAVLYLWWKY